MMNELNEMREQDRLKCIQLLGEIREVGKGIDEPIEIEYLNLSIDRHTPRRKILIPLSELNDPNHLTHLKPEHKVLIPILIKYLNEFKTVNFKDIVVNSLKVKGFYDATEPLLNEFYTTNLNDTYKWSIGDSFSIILDKRFIDQYISIISDKKYGTARQMVTIALGKLKSEKALPVLLSLLDDEDVNGHVIMSLGYYKKPELIKYIEPFLTHKKAWIRAQAKSAINKIDK
jgi:hypothetical protein